MNNIEKLIYALRQLVQSATSDEQEARTLMVRARNRLSHPVSMTAANRKKQQELSAEIAEYLHKSSVPGKDFAAALNEVIDALVCTVAERLNKNIDARVRAILNDKKSTNRKR